MSSSSFTWFYPSPSRGSTPAHSQEHSKLKQQHAKLSDEAAELVRESSWPRRIWPQRSSSIEEDECVWLPLCQQTHRLLLRVTSQAAELRRRVARLRVQVDPRTKAVLGSGGGGGGATSPAPEGGGGSDGLGGWEEGARPPPLPFEPAVGERAIPLNVETAKEAAAHEAPEIPSEESSSSPRGAPLGPNPLGPLARFAPRAGEAGEAPSLLLAPRAAPAPASAVLTCGVLAFPIHTFHIRTFPIHTFPIHKARERALHQLKLKDRKCAQLEQVVTPPLTPSAPHPQSHPLHPPPLLPSLFSSLLPPLLPSHLSSNLSSPLLPSHLPSHLSRAGAGARDGRRQQGGARGRAARGKSGATSWRRHIWPLERRFLDEGLRLPSARQNSPMWLRWTFRPSGWLRPRRSCARICSRRGVWRRHARRARRRR